MTDERITSAQAWKAYIATKARGDDMTKGVRPTQEVIDAFFEGYKAGIIDGTNTTLEVLNRVAEKQP